jgi:hypothetical protein
MATETQIIQQQESPAVEAYKLGLMQQAQQLIEKPIALPAPTAVGADPMTLQAQRLAQAGVGSFQPFLTSGNQFVTDAGKQLQLANQIAAGIPGEYNPAQQEAVRGTALGAQMGQQAATSGIQALAGTEAQYDPVSAQAFMNPYETQVIDQALADIQRAGNIAGQADAARAVSAGAFGGSRSGIVDSERGRNILEQQAKTAAGLRAQGYGQAIQQSMGAQESALQRQQKTANLLGQLGLAGADATGQAAGQLGQLALQRAQLGQQSVGQTQDTAKTLAALGQTTAGLGQLGQQMQLGDVDALTRLGAQQQVLDQAAADQAQQFALQQVYQPYQKLGFYSDILQGAPSTSMSVTQNTSPRPSILNQAVGAGIGGLGIANAAQNVGII